MSDNMLHCFNRGCGQKFDPNDNKDDSCCYHPGAPYFHDAYKEWTCCKKKSVDFTEFLNFPGCTKSKHTNIKPLEPVKEAAPIKINETPKEIRLPVQVSKNHLRPSFESPLIKINPKVNENLKNSIDSIKWKDSIKDIKNESNSGDVPLGTTCYNGGCNYVYESSDAEYSQCVYHPGMPIFHEGMKFWSCCQKRTSDFTAFLSQKGCSTGQHKWFENQSELTCRYDWHQTATDVIVAIYAKMYHYETSSIQVNPIRLNVNLLFPEMNNQIFKLDMELRGVIKVAEVKVSMLATKVEITMPKAEPGSWSTLEMPKSKIKKISKKESCEKNETSSDIELDDIMPISPNVHF